tara:strand:+ start:424 stop:657 length:234 start_codon:yes stop_codon:yes gene_type:complete
VDSTIKYKIISKIINSDDEKQLQAVKSILGIKDDEDFWDELSVEDQASIDEGLNQLEKGKYVSHQSVKEEITRRFNF